MLSWKSARQREAAYPLRYPGVIAATDLTGTRHMKTLRFLPLLALLAVVGLAAGCGGSGKKSVPTNAVAVVGNDTITKVQFNTLIAGAQRNYKARKTAF